MRTKTLKRIEISTATLLLSLFIGCGKSSAPTDESNEAATNASAAQATAATATGAPVAPVSDETPAGMVRYDAQPTGSKCTIEGTSSLSHGWEMSSAIVTGFIIADPKFPESALTDPATAKPRVQVAFPVKAFKSGKATMDQKMQLCMSVTNHPKIEYTLIELKPKSSPGTTGPLEFEAIGALTIVGTTRTNTMPVKIEKNDTKLKVTGHAPIKFTDYNMKPPAITVLGADIITVGDDLKVDFEWSLAQKPAAAAQP